MRAAWLFKLSLLLEIAIEAAIALALADVFGWSPWSVVLAIPLLGLVWRTVVFGTEFFLAQLRGETVPVGDRPGLAGWIRTYLRELTISAYVFQWLQPFASSAAPWAFAPPSRVRANRPVVLLVHGLVCNAAVWKAMRPVLIDAGFEVEFVNLEVVYGAIDGYADPLHACIESICERRGVDRLLIVAHSMGGLVTRKYMAVHGHARVAHAITIGTPHAGTWLAHLGRSANVRDMRLGSPFLADLEARRGGVPYRDFTCLFTWQDNLVTPQRNALLPGADAIAFNGVGHLAMLFDPVVHRCVAEVLRRYASAAAPKP